jgi:hypothetical protein
MSTNCHARNMSVLRQQANLKRWKDSVSYGYRWMAETVFSSMKRMFGEHLSARKFPNMVKEIIIKAALYNGFNQILNELFLDDLLEDHATKQIYPAYRCYFCY